MEVLSTPRPVPKSMH